MGRKKSVVITDTNGISNNSYTENEPKGSNGSVDPGRRRSTNGLMSKMKRRRSTLADDMMDHSVALESIGETCTDKTADDKDAAEKKPEAYKTVTMRQLFRFADRWDAFFMIIGSICSMIHGACLPLLMVIFGEVVDLFIERSVGERKLGDIPWSYYNTSQEEALQDEQLIRSILQNENRSELADELNFDVMEDLTDYMNRYAIYPIYMALAVTVTAYLQVSLWFRASQRQGQKIRAHLFKCILKQDIGWFDTHQPSELNTRMADDIDVIMDGFGDKIGVFLQWMAAAVTGVVVGYESGWKLALVVTSLIPIIAAIGSITSRKSVAYTIKEMNAYAKAGAVAEQAFSSFRTVLSFGGEDKETERYTSKLGEARSIGIRKGAVHGCGPAMMMGCIYCMYGLCFWYGARLIREGEYTPGAMLTVFYGVIIGAFSLGNAFPNLQYVAEARGAAYALWEIMDTEPEIDWTNDGGAKPDSCTGKLRFAGVDFSYPARKDTQVLKNVSLEISPGQTVALVGSSGCGKSTTIQLLQRFYDPDEGNIYIDDTDITTLNIQWLRQHIGVVSQEPVLFATTIEENIKFGRDNVTQQEIEEACRKANAYDFIQKLPEKFQTLVGERGSQLSGGQKQRIAIARALVRDPKILLLDEATSALDTESEATVQAALDKAREGRTTIVIAHRLSTVKTADVIYGFCKGEIVEYGSHEELMERKNGIYRELVLNQLADRRDSREDIFEEVELSDVIMEAKLDRQLSSFRERSDTNPDKPKTVTDENDDTPPNAPFFWAMQQNSPETIFIILGAVGAFLHGIKQPVFAIIFAEMFAVFELPIDEQSSKVNLYAWLFVVIGGVTAVAIFTQHFMFNYSGSHLTMRLRSKSFKKLMSQDVSYYDLPKNNTGAVVANLATHTSAIQGATGVQLGFLLQSLAGVGVGILIGLYYSWKMTLGIVAFVPFIYAAGIMTQKFMRGASKSNKHAMEAAASLGVQAIENIRTVASLSKQQWFINKYVTNTLIPFRKAIRSSHIHGASYACTASFLFFAYAGSFYFAAFLIEDGQLEFENMMKVFMAIVFSAMTMGHAARYVPSYAKGKMAAAYLRQLLNSTSEINGQDDKGIKPDKTVGKLEFRSVRFSYPTRSSVPVLRGLNLTVNPGEIVALVGSSGCGKSTSIQLIERFYDPVDGDVLLDGNSLKSVNIRWLRSQMGLVSQEPVLFDATIAENIAYGDNSRDVEMPEIIRAARSANIHNFIEGLPQGYDTNVGDRGTQLSGGQKQRIAIARALVRDPKILLLDEATSALDTESEKLVQEALDRAQKGRTSIVIAHRLSTIVNADKIVVFHHGKIVETGTHAELITLQGYYYKLNQNQFSAA